jgi:hypothetical protein
LKESEKLVGKVKTHATLGKVTVDSINNGSRVMVNITVIDRGKGYDEVSGTYKGVRIRTGWYRGENRQFGHKDTAHIKELN